MLEILLNKVNVKFLFCSVYDQLTLTTFSIFFNNMIYLHYLICWYLDFMYHVFKQILRTPCSFPSENLALNRNTSQRETAEGNPGFEPKSAVDGNVNTCSKTQDEEPRWCVNLGMKRYVVGLNIIVPQRGSYLFYSDLSITTLCSKTYLSCTQIEYSAFLPVTTKLIFLACIR